MCYSLDLILDHFPASKFQTYPEKMEDSIPLATVRDVQWAVKVKTLLCFEGKDSPLGT